VFGLKRGFVGRGSEFVRIRENMWDCLDWGMIEWICENDLFKFVIDMIVKKELENYFKGVIRKFTNLSLLLKNI